MKHHTVCQCVQARMHYVGRCRTYMTASLLSAVHDHMTNGLLGWTGGGGVGQHAWHHAYRHEKLQRCNEKVPPSSMQACKDIQRATKRQYLASCPSAHRSRCVLRCLASQRPRLRTPPPCLGYTSCRPSCSSARATRHSLHGTCSAWDQCRFMRLRMLQTCDLTQHKMGSSISMM